jgi:hypothetical protein
VNQKQIRKSNLNFEHKLKFYQKEKKNQKFVIFKSLLSTTDQKKKGRTMKIMAHFKEMVNFAQYFYFL